MRVKFVTYATPDFLEALGHWLATVQGHGLDYYYEKIKDRGSWRGNCAYCAEFMCKMASRFEKTHDALVWLDADGLVLKYPKLLFEIGTDAAWHVRPNGALMTGTVFLRLNERVIAFLEKWRKLSESYIGGKAPDQRALQVLHSRDPLSHTKLPAEYCSFYREVPGMENLVIAHFRAGR